MKLMLAWVVTNAIATGAGVIGGLGAAMAAYSLATKAGIIGVVLAIGLYPIAGFVLGAVAATGQHLVLRRYLPISGLRWIARSGAASALILMPAFIVGWYVIAPVGSLFPDALCAPFAGRLFVGLHFAVIGALMGAVLGWAQRREFHRAGCDAPRWTVVNAIGAAVGCALVLGGTAFAPQGALGRGAGTLITAGPIFGLVGAAAAVITGMYLKGIVERRV
ncbi:MAG: hypothetical protein ACRDFA_07315 [bacterium]